MSKLTAEIPLGEIEWIRLYIGGCKKTLAQVMAETGADYAINGGMWNPDGSACPLLKADGDMVSAAPWSAYGYGWDTGPDIRLLPNARETANFISCTCLIGPWGPVNVPSYGSAQGGRRGRSAIGIRDGCLMLYCSGDGTADAATPEELRDELSAAGWESAVMLDGGGSSQCDFGDGGKIVSSRKVHNIILVKLETQTETEDTVGKQYQVTPAIGLNIRSGPGTGYGKSGAYACGAVVSILEEQNGWGRTDRGWVSLAYLEPVEAPRQVTDNGIAIREHLIPREADNRPGGANPCTYITIHETGNTARGADAAAHGSYLDSAAGEQAMVSWHYTVDDHAIVQHLPDGERAYHAGDGANGPGNRTSIGIELCVNAGGDFAATQANAAALVRLLMAEHGIDIGHVVQHNHWNGKDCPRTIRATPGAWDGFLALCRGETPADGVSELDTAVDKLAAAGLIDSPDYWKAGDYSAENVRALLIKWAASL